MFCHPLTEPAEIQKQQKAFFVLQCQSYDIQRQMLIMTRHIEIGITTPDKATLLGLGKHPYIDVLRDTINTELDHNFIETGRFSRAISGPETNP